MASTLKEISQAAGTSVSTASLILNGRQAHRFTEATQAAVIKAAAPKEDEEALKAALEAVGAEVELK